MSNTKVLFREFTSLKEDGTIEIIENKKLNIITLVLTENGTSVKMRFDYNIQGDTSEERLSYVDNLRRKANLLGRASTFLKNDIKNELYSELLKEGTIDKEIYNKKLGK